MKKSELKSSLILILTAMIWGSGFVAQRLGMSAISPVFFNGFRSLIATVLLFFVALLADRKRGISEGFDKRTIKAGIFCGFILFLAGNFQQIGLVDTSAGKSGFITALYIVIVPVLSIFLKKKCTPYNWIGVVLAVIGLYFLCVTGNFGLRTSDLILLLGALFWALHILFVDHFAKGLNGIKVSAVQFATSGVLSIAFAIPLEDMTIGGLGEAMPAILYCAIFSSGIAFTLQIIGQQMSNNPTVASVIMSTESLWAVVFGFIILGESLSSRELIGCILMFAAIIIAQIPYKREDTNLP